MDHCALHAASYAIFIVLCGYTHLLGLLRAMSCMVICNERGSAPQDTLQVEKILVVDWEGIQQRNISELHFFYRGGEKQCLERQKVISGQSSTVWCKRKKSFQHVVNFKHFKQVLKGLKDIIKCFSASGLISDHLNKIRNSVRLARMQN